MSEEENLRQFSLRIPQALLDHLYELSLVTGRSITAEILSAIRRHIKAPPAVVEINPPLPAEDLVRNPPRKKTGGREYTGGYKGSRRRSDDDRDE